MREVERYFPLGSEWIYIKLYMGSKTSEKFLIKNFLPCAEQLMNQKIIDKWFFINYFDDNRHIRLRLHVVNKEINLNSVIKQIYEITKPFLNERLIYSIVADTYKREIERYGGISNIEHFETLFYNNSRLILKILEYCEDQPDKRWLWGLKSIDFILDDWGLNLSMKKTLFESLNKSFGEEMGTNSLINKQLSLKFRNNRSKINYILENDEGILKEILVKHNKRTVAIVKKIKENLKLEVLSDVLSSYIHMHFNRLFSSRQRMNEWVIYYLLYQYYRSKIAQLKHKNQKR